MKKITVSLVLSLLPYCAFSDVFQADITVTNSPIDTQKKSFGFNNAENFFDQLTRNGIKQDFNNYSDTSGVKAVTDYQGVLLNINLPQNSSTNELILSIPKLNFTKTFTGPSRSNTTQQLKNYLKSDIDGTATHIVEYQVGNTPNSPLTGNPSSLGGQMVAIGFNNATNIPTTNLPYSSPDTSSSPVSDHNSTGGSNSSSSSANPVIVGVAGGTYTQKGLDISVFNVPISKAFNIDSDDPRKKLLLNGQFNYITVGQAASYQGAVGIGYMHPITDHWYLIPSINYGAIGSQDLASLGQIFSTSLSSNYQFRLPGYDMALVNMFGYYKTLPLNISGVISSNPDINNYVFKNGIFASKVVPFLFGQDVRVKGFFTDTEFTGSKVFIRQYNEVGLELSSVRKVGWLDKISFGLADSLALSAKYIFSIQDPNNFEGYEIGVGYDF